MIEILSLGGLIAILERRDQNEPVVFDFCGMLPTHLESYRGYYADLALGHAPGGGMRSSGPTVSDLLRTMQGAVGKTFTGYKGGEYRMDPGTRLWVDNPGDASGTALVGVADDDITTVLLTRYVR
jgi:hypothetical protein